MNTTTATALTYAEAQRIVREAVRDKTYQLYPLGMEAAAISGSPEQHRRSVERDRSKRC